MDPIKFFPNGFIFWSETFHEISILSHIQRDKEGTQANIVYNQGGGPGFVEHIRDLTDIFEVMNYGREWDGEFYDEVEDFVNGKGGRNRYILKWADDLSESHMGIPEILRLADELWANEHGQDQSGRIKKDQLLNFILHHKEEYNCRSFSVKKYDFIP